MVPTRSMVVAGIVAAALLGLTAAPSASRDPGSIFPSLLGTWEGTGTLMRRPAVFRMSWRDGADGFTHLEFTNAWVDDAGTKTPILRATAVYFEHESTVRGVWIDDRPQRAYLESTVTDSSLISIWSAEQEKGKTEYVVRSPGVVVVRDWVEIEQEMRLFGEASYSRSGSSLDGRD